jgi:hypothetical protein
MEKISAIVNQNSERSRSVAEVIASKTANNTSNLRDRIWFLWEIALAKLNNEGKNFQSVVLRREKERKESRWVNKE